MSGNMSPRTRKVNSTHSVDSWNRGGGSSASPIAFAFIGGGGGGGNYTGNYSIGGGGQGGGFRAGGITGENSGGASANLGALDIDPGTTLQVTVGGGGGGGTAPNKFCKSSCEFAVLY